jgi:hypothetical protein
VVLGCRRQRVYEASSGTLTGHSRAFEVPIKPDRSRFGNTKAARDGPVLPFFNSVEHAQHLVARPCLCVPRTPTNRLSSDTMVALLCFFLTLFTSPFRSKNRLETENATLRHQLTVLRPKVRKARRAATRRGRRLRIIFAVEARFGRINRPRPCWTSFCNPDARRAAERPGHSRWHERFLNRDLEKTPQNF